MGRWTNTETPDVLKTVALNDDERIRFRRIFRLNARVRSRLNEVVRELLAEQLDEEEDVWNELAKKCDYPNMDALANDGCAIEVNWGTGTLNLRGKKV